MVAFYVGCFCLYVRMFGAEAENCLFDGFQHKHHHHDPDHNPTSCAQSSPALLVDVVAIGAAVVAAVVVVVAWLFSSIPRPPSQEESIKIIAWPRLITRDSWLWAIPMFF